METLFNLHNLLNCSSNSIINNSISFYNYTPNNNHDNFNFINKSTSLHINCQSFNSFSSAYNYNSDNNNNINGLNNFFHIHNYNLINHINYSSRDSTACDSSSCDSSSCNISPCNSSTRDFTSLQSLRGKWKA